VCFILRFKKELKKTINASKIIIDKREAKDNAREARKTKVETKRIEASTKASAKANARATTIVATTIITTTNKKQLLKLHEQSACTHVSLVFETISMLSSCLLLFNNLREYTSNTLYNQKLIKLLN